MPALTIAVGLVTAVVSIVALAHPDLLRLLERHPTPDAPRAPWRMLTPLLVHDGWFALTFNLIGFAIVGAAVERRLGAARWIVLYLAGGIVGELVGVWWQPIGAGNSVASFGVAGALVAETFGSGGTFVTLSVLYAAEWMLVYAGLELDGVAGALIAGVLCAPLSAVFGGVRRTAPRALGVWLAAGTLAIAVVLCAVRDIHGPPFVAGMILGWILHRRRRLTMEE